MQNFYDIATNKQYAFENNVVVSGAPGTFVFTTQNGARLGPYPPTLVVGVAPTPPVVPVPLSQQAAALLTVTDTTMHRVSEAVALGLNTWTNAGVVAWANYRRALRAIANGTDTTSTVLPTKPAYPVGT